MELTARQGGLREGRDVEEQIAVPSRSAQRGCAVLQTEHGLRSNEALQSSTTTHRKTPTARAARAQKTVEMSQVQLIDKLVDVLSPCRTENSRNASDCASTKEQVTKLPQPSHAEER